MSERDDDDEGRPSVASAGQSGEEPVEEKKKSLSEMSDLELAAYARRVELEAHAVLQEKKRRAASTDERTADAFAEHILHFAQVVDPESGRTLIVHYIRRFLREKRDLPNCRRVVDTLRGNLDDEGATKLEDILAKRYPDGWQAEVERAHRVIKRFREEASDEEARRYGKLLLSLLPPLGGIGPLGTGSGGETVVTVAGVSAKKAFAIAMLLAGVGTAIYLLWPRSSRSAQRGKGLESRDETGVAGGGIDPNGANPDASPAPEAVVAPNVRIAPASLQFGIVEQTTTARREFTIANTAATGAGLAYFVALTEPDPEIALECSPQCSQPIQPGAIATVSVRYSPSGIDESTPIAERTRSLRASIAVSANGTTFLVSLSGARGYSQVLAPLGLDWGKVQVGARAVSTIEVGNVGNIDVTINSMTLVGDNAISFADGPSGNCTSGHVCNEDVVMRPGGRADVKIACDPEDLTSKSARLEFGTGSGAYPPPGSVEISCTGNMLKAASVVTLVRGLPSGVTPPTITMDGMGSRMSLPDDQLYPTLTKEFFDQVFHGFTQGIVGKCAYMTRTGGRVRLGVVLYQGLNADGSHAGLVIVGVFPVALPRADLSEFGNCVQRDAPGIVFNGVRETGFWTVTADYELPYGTSAESAASARAPSR